MKQNKKEKGLLVSKIRKLQWNHKRSLKKITKTAHWRAPRKAALFSEHSIAIHSISVVGYITASLMFVCVVHRACQASSFCDFTLPYAISLHFSPFWYMLTFVFADVLIKEYCSLSVSKHDQFWCLGFLLECCSEEVMFLLMLSVLYYTERQKKLIISSGRCSLNSMLSKLIFEISFNTP